MDDFQRADRTRGEARILGLINSGHYSLSSGECFNFDLNQGEMSSVDQDPWKILLLVSLARSNAREEGYGEHNALLSLVARVSEINDRRVYWHRPYHVNALPSDTKWISLAEWLAWCGCPYIATK
jgi:hypothetical protein